MEKVKADNLILGVALIVLTKVFDFSSIFLLIGLFLVFDALFSNKTSENETE